MLEDLRKHLLRKQVIRFSRRHNRLHESALVQFKQRHRPKQCAVIGREEQAVARRFCATPSPSKSLKERRDGSRRVNLNDTIEITNIDAEFECARRDDHAVLRLGERLLRLPALVETQRAVRHECVDLKALEFVAELLGALTAIDEHKSLFATM